MQTKEQYGIKTGRLLPPKHIDKIQDLRAAVGKTTKQAKENSTIRTNLPLKLGDNTIHRLCRPAWMSEKSTGNFDAYKSRQGKHLEREYYTYTHGLYKKMKKNGATTVVKRGGERYARS